MENARSNNHGNSGPEIQHEDEYAENQLYQRLVAKMRSWMKDSRGAGRTSNRGHTSPLDKTWKILITLVRQLCGILSNGLEVMWDVGKGVEEGKYSNFLVSDETAGGLILLKDFKLMCCSNRLEPGPPLVRRGKRESTLFMAANHINTKRNIQRRM